MPGRWNLPSGYGISVRKSRRLESLGLSRHKRFEMFGVPYTFNVEGKEYPTPDGGTASWKALDGNTLTNDAVSVSGREPIKVVHDRQ